MTWHINTKDDGTFEVAHDFTSAADAQRVQSSLNLLNVR